jgi:hypothetical protein
MNLDITQQIVLNLVSGTLFSYPIKLPDSTDWNRLYMEAIQQAVFPIVYPAVCNQLPTDEQGRWSIGFYNALASNMRVNYEHTELDSMMKNAGIPYVILKGVASDSYYPEPNLRTMGMWIFLCTRLI